MMTKQLKFYLLVIALTLTSTLVACGQTGDLYLPEEESKQKSKDKS